MMIIIRVAIETVLFLPFVHCIKTFLNCIKTAQKIFKNTFLHNNQCVKYKTHSCVHLQIFPCKT